MPIFGYFCEACKKSFDELVKDYGSPVCCPDCKKPAKRLWCGDMFSATGKPVKKCGGNCKTCRGCK